MKTLIVVTKIMNCKNVINLLLDLAQMAAILDFNAPLKKCLANALSGKRIFERYLYQII